MRIKAFDYVLTIDVSLNKAVKNKAEEILRWCDEHSYELTKVSRIKATRELYGLGMWEAKELVESLFGNIGMEYDEQAS